MNDTQPHKEAMYYTGSWEDFDPVKLYGRNFDPSVFNPFCSNIRTGQIGRTHHCKKKGCENRPRSRYCFLPDSNYHQGFCMARMDVANGNDTFCGQAFQVDSGGCGRHPYVEGYNYVFKELQRRKSLSDEAKGIKKKTPEEIEEERKKKEQEQEEIDNRTYKYYEEQKAKTIQAAIEARAARRPTRTKTKKQQPAPTLRSQMSKRTTCG